MTSALKTAISSDRQRYVDEPVYVEVSKAKPLALELSGLPWRLRGGPPICAAIQRLSHHERTLIRWMIPDGRGGLKPKYTR